MMRRWLNETNPVMLGYYLGILVCLGIIVATGAIDRLCDRVEPSPASAHTRSRDGLLREIRRRNSADEATAKER